MKAGRGIKLLNSDKMYTPQDESLVTTDLTAIMKGGSPDEELLRQQQYGSLYKRGTELLQKITGNPKNLNDMEVRAHLRDVINGVKEIDNDVIKNHIDSLESTYADTIANHPKQWDAYKAKQLKFVGLGPDAAPAPKPGGQESNIPAIGAIIDGHKFKGGDPSKPENWEKQ